MRKTGSWATAWLVVVLATGGCGGESHSPDTPDESAGTTAPTARVTLGGRTWTVRLAQTEAQRERGLAGVRYLPSDEGMLFIFPDTQTRRFWMKGCRIPLDVAFLDEERRVVSMHTMALAQHDPPRRAYPSGKPARYALEVPAGTLDAAGVEVGDVAAFTGVAKNSDRR
ncbi:MAG: DUF192 domain-containing protein [Phycisphaerae bacterium]|nr:DUF192 domain-containing protein [Phycisphaerae bacterium]